MSDESLAVQVAKLESAKHNHANTLQEHAGKLDALDTKAGTMEREVAIVQTELTGLKSTVTTGFVDLKDVIIHRAEQDVADRERQHELAVTAAADRRAFGMKVLGLVATALTIAGGGGGALYAMSGDPPERPPIVAPVAP